VELLNHFPTGRTFHQYVNPQRPVSAGALEVHGLTDDFLSDKPVYGEIADKFSEFIGADTLVIHNAPFDVGFINAELDRLGRTPIEFDRVIDTLFMARRKHPAGPNSLNGLCTRYGIDNSRRDKHGALLDAELLADVYIEMVGGRQASLGLTEDAQRHTDSSAPVRAGSAAIRPKPLPPRLNQAEDRAHRAFIMTLGESAIWRKYLDLEADS
jgi:DNA polymerase-3 subunit epsilon